jgi:chaperonin GroES
MLKPLGDRVLVGEIKLEEKTESGIMIINEHPVMIQEGIVIRCGPGLPDDTGRIQPISVQDGDRISFGKFAGQPIQMDGVDYKVMHEHEILGIV